MSMVFSIGVVTAGFAAAQDTATHSYLSFPGTNFDDSKINVVRDTANIGVFVTEGPSWGPGGVTIEPNHVTFSRPLYVLKDNNPYTAVIIEKSSSLTANGGLILFARATQGGHGIDARGGSRVTVNNSPLDVSAVGGYGILLSGQSTLNGILAFNSDALRDPYNPSRGAYTSSGIRSSGDYYHALAVTEGSSVNLGIAGSMPLYISSYGQWANAISASGGSNVFISNTDNGLVSIAAEGSSASHAIYADASVVNIGASRIFVYSGGQSSQGGYGILSQNGSQINISGPTAISTRNVGLATNSGGVISLNGGGHSIITADDYAHGILAGLNNTTGGQIDITGDLSVNTSASNANGIWAMHGGAVNLFNKVTVRTRNDNSHGLVAGGEGTSGSIVTAADSFVDIKTLNANSIGILVQDGGSINIAHTEIHTGQFAVASGNGAHGVQVGTTTSSGSFTLGLDKTLSVTTQGPDAHGFYAQNNANIKLWGSTNIKTMGENSYGLYITNGTDLVSGGDLTITQSNNAAAIRIGDRAVINANSSTASTTVNAFHGNAILYSGFNGQVILNHATLSNANYSGKALLHSDDISNTLTLTNSTALTTGELISGSAMTLNADNTKLAGSVNNAGIMRLNNASSWDTHHSSALNTLELSADSRVNLRSSTPGAYNTLTVNTLDGTGGTFLMNVDMGARRGDLLAAHEITGGAYVLDIANNGAAVTNGTEVLTVVQANSNGANHSLTNPVEAGGYVYNLRQQQGSNSYELYGFKSNDGNNPNPGNPGGTIDPTSPWTPWFPQAPNISTTANAAASTLKTGYLLTYVDTQTLLQRMGELRNTPDHQGDFWVRGFTGTLDSFGSGKLSGFEMDYDGMQAGIDRQFDLASGKLYVGVMGGYTHGSPGYDNNAGSGTVKGTHAGAYGTYRHEGTGIYVDGIIKYNRLKHEFSVRDTAGAGVTGSGTSHGYTVSVEAGKRFHPIAATPAFYLEPQVQLSYNRQSGTDIYASNGLHVNMDNYSSVQGRTSLIIGYRIDDEKNPVDLYAKTGYTREFRDNSAYYLNGSRETNEFGGGWVDLGLGVSATINNRHHIFGEFNFSQGSQFDRRQFNLGYRYQF